MAEAGALSQSGVLGGRSDGERNTMLGREMGLERPLEHLCICISDSLTPEHLI